MATRIDTVGLSATYGAHHSIADINLVIDPKQVTAIIGPSGCGKSTLLRCLNGMHMTIPRAGVTGRVELNGANIYDPGTDLVMVRRRVGMVFQKPNPFPTMSIYDNVIAGLRLGRRRRPRGLDDLVERSLVHAGLWVEVKDRLGKAGASLSGGQQQRLCIARALAIEPEVVLMDEPCSALDPISTLTIEDTIGTLKDDYTIVIVTHNMQQAARVSDTTAFMTITDAGQPGRLVEIGRTDRIFSTPVEKATEDYISGKVG
jgi:phosphate transport system ATP-binding protein